MLKTSSVIIDLNGPDGTKSCFRLAVGDEAQKRRCAGDHLLRSLAASVLKEELLIKRLDFVQVLN